MDEHGVVAVCFEVGVVTRAEGSSLKSADLLCSVKTQNTENIRPKMLYFVAPQTKEMVLIAIDITNMGLGANH